MAILKHFNVKNSDYSAAVRYFVFQHDNHARPVKNGQGRFILRNNYLIDGINCCPLSYDIECRSSNQKWRKNLGKNDVKQHHFIISFEPSDVERGFTVDKAQKFGIEFAKHYFAGHQCIVATHSDGNNESGNIHCHIAFNSLRVEDLPERPVYTEFERDRLAGYKFHPTDKCMRYLKQELMELCRANGLGQVELNKPAKKQVKDKEYWAQKRGQKRTAAKTTKFQTELAQIRTAIDAAKAKASSVKEFKEILQQDYSIIIRDKRGRWSYTPKDRKQGITARRLGADYSVEAVTAFLAEQTQRKNRREKSVQTIPNIPIESMTEPLILFVAHRLYNLDEPKFKNSLGLERWAKLQNLKEMSRRFNFLSENHALSAEGLVSAFQIYSEKLSSKMAQNADITDRINDINKLLRWEGQLNKTKLVWNQYRSITNPRQKNAFYTQHQSDVQLHQQAATRLRDYKASHGYGDRPLPSMKQLSAEKASLIAKRNLLTDEITTLQTNVKLLADAQNDVMNACADLNLTSRSEYSQIFDQQMSIRRQVKQKNQQQQQYEQNSHCKSRDHQELE